MKPIIFFLFFLIIVGVIASRLFSPAPAAPAEDKIKIVASFYPLAEFAQQVGGDDVTVTNLTPPGVEPHDFEATPQDILRVQKSQLVIINGTGFEPWLNKIQPDLPSTVKVVNTSTGLSVHAGDPHVWLDPVLAQQQVATITQALITLDPAHQADYQQRATAYQAQLDQLHQDFQTTLATCQTRQVITAHDAFQYLAERYDLEILSIAGLSPEIEPSPSQLAELAAIMRQNGLKYVFFETLTSPLLAQTLAQEVGAQTLVFNPLEGLTESQLTDGQNYLTIQRQNLHNLHIALDCTVPIPL